MTGARGAIKLAGRTHAAARPVGAPRATPRALVALDVTGWSQAGECALAPGATVAVSVGAVTHATGIVPQAGHFAGRSAAQDRAVLPSIAEAPIAVAVQRRVVVAASVDDEADETGGDQKSDRAHAGIVGSSGSRRHPWSDLEVAMHRVQQIADD